MRSQGEGLLRLLQLRRLQPRNWGEDRRRTTQWCAPSTKIAEWEALARRRRGCGYCAFDQIVECVPDSPKMQKAHYLLSLALRPIADAACASAGQQA